MSSQETDKWVPNFYGAHDPLVEIQLNLFFRNWNDDTPILMFLSSKWKYVICIASLSSSLLWYCKMLLKVIYFKPWVMTKISKGVYSIRYSSQQLISFSRDQKQQRSKSRLWFISANFYSSLTFWQQLSSLWEWMGVNTHKRQLYFIPFLSLK